MVATMKNEDIRTRLNRLKQLRTTVQDTWDEIERYIAPYRGRFFKDERNENSIEWRRPYVFDSTAIHASQSLAAHIHSSLTSPKIKWFDLRYRDPEIDDQEANEWLELLSDQVYQVLQDSNFDVQAGETYQDLVDFGTSIITEEVESEDEWKGINFSSVPLKECFFEQDHKGNVVNFFRVLEWSAVQIVSKFKEKVPTYIKEEAEDATKAEKRHKIIFCIWRREGTTANPYKPTPPANRAYGYRYITQETLEQLGEDGGYYEMPAFVPRWRKTSSSMWGNSPSMVALSDVLSLNKLVELHINAMEKVVDPATMATERGLMGDLDLNPGGLTVVRSLDDIKPFESAARFDVSYQEIQRYRDQIREYFMIDQLMLPPMEGTPATATEIAARISQLERLIGPTLGRLQNDFLDPCITRTVNILIRAGQLPEPPESIRESDTGLDIEYVGALARSQQQDLVTAVDRWLMTLGQVAQVKPDVMDIPDWDAMLKGVGAMLGVPAKYMRPDRDIKQTRNIREQQEQEMMEAQIAQQQGEAMQAQNEAMP